MGLKLGQPITSWRASPFSRPQSAVHSGMPFVPLVSALHNFASGSPRRAKVENSLPSSLSNVLFVILGQAYACCVTKAQQTAPKLENNFHHQGTDKESCQTKWQANFGPGANQYLGTHMDGTQRGAPLWTLEWPCCVVVTVFAPSPVPVSYAFAPPLLQPCPSALTMRIS